MLCMLCPDCRVHAGSGSAARPNKRVRGIDTVETNRLVVSKKDDSSAWDEQVKAAGSPSYSKKHATAS